LGRDCYERRFYVGSETDEERNELKEEVSGKIQTTFK